jgi:GGDEF domain-containing protein
LVQRKSELTPFTALAWVKQVNARFGYKAGDGLLAKLATYLGSAANPEQGLYRWSGPALLAT